MTVATTAGDHGNHAGELLSALVDGELSEDERQRVEAHLDGCSRCSHELHLLERSRAALLALPELEPPGDFIGAIVARRHRLILRGALGSFAVALASAVLMLATDLAPAPAVQPELASLTAEHSTTAVTAPDTSFTDSSATFDGVRVDNQVAGFDLVAVRETDRVVHAVYRQDQRVVSIYGQRGRLDWNALPAGGSRGELAGRDVWQADDESSTVLDAGGVVITIVGEGTEVQAVLASEVGEVSSPSWWDRAHDAAQTVLGDFHFG